MIRSEATPEPSPTPTFAPAVLGRRHEELDLGWARLIDARHDPALRLRPHEHRHSAITLVRSGSFRLAWRASEEDCPAKSVFFKRGGERHSNRFGPTETRSLVIELKDEEGRLERGPVALTLPERSAPAGSRAGLLADQLESEWQTRDRSTGLAVEGRLLLLLDALIGTRGRERREPAWLRAVDDSLRASVATPPTISTLADRAEVDAAHLARTYRRYRGVTIGRALRVFRLEEAHQRVTSTSEPLAQIASELGFYDQAHFTRAFKRHFGATPGRVRRG